MNTTELAWTQIWQTSAVALGVGVVVWASGRRRPHLAYLLWLVVILKSLTPPVVSSPTGLFSWAMMTPSATESPSSRGPTTVANAKAEFPVSSESSGAAQDGFSVSEINAGATSNRPRIATVLTFIWLAGVLACAGFVIVRLARVSSRLRRSALPLDSHLLTQLSACAERLGLGRRPRLIVTSQPIGPAVFGFVRPVVVVPSLLTQDQSPGLAPILSHELIHIRRGDPFVAVIQVFAQCVWWFHPLIWWANRQASRERERACDEEVLAELKLDPAAYGQCLVDILRMKQRLRPVLAFPGVRAMEVTTRRLEHIMQPEPRFHVRTPRWCWAMLLVAAFVALPGAGLALDTAQQPNSRAEQAQSEPSRSTTASDTADEPTVLVLPIRTELQHELIPGGKSARALVLLNGFATVGKRGVDRMRALDILALRRSLAAIQAKDPNASVAFVIGYLDESPQVAWQAFQLQENQKLLTQECRDLAKEFKLGVTKVSVTWVNAPPPGLWEKVVGSVKEINLANETALESSVGDSEVRAFPVRTRMTRFLTRFPSGSSSRSSDCIVYIDRPLNLADQPLVGPDLEAHIKRVVSNLDLPKKDRVDFHLIQPKLSGQAAQKYSVAIRDRFAGKPSQHLAELLGFKESSVSY